VRKLATQVARAWLDQRAAVQGVAQGTGQGAAGVSA
jgi:hypothetical protein